jgi:hypothetical protein
MGVCPLKRNSISMSHVPYIRHVLLCDRRAIPQGDTHTHKNTEVLCVYANPETRQNFTHMPTQGLPLPQSALERGTRDVGGKTVCPYACAERRLGGDVCVVTRVHCIWEFIMKTCMSQCVDGCEG